MTTALIAIIVTFSTAAYIALPVLGALWLIYVCVGVALICLLALIAAVVRLFRIRRKEAESLRRDRERFAEENVARDERAATDYSFADLKGLQDDADRQIRQ